MRNVDFEFTKDWGSIKKKTVKNIDRSMARSLQDKHKVGKIKVKNKVEKKVLSNKDGTTD